MSIRERGSESRLATFVLRLLLRGGIVFGVAVAVLQVALLRPLLPDPMANRFSWDGRGVAWIGTSEFLMIHLVVVASTAGLFIGLPLLLRIAERRSAGRATDGDRLSSIVEFEQWTLLFGLATTTFTLGVTHLVVVANFAHPPQLSLAFPALLAVYLAFTATWTVQVVRRFRHRGTATPAPA